MKLLWKSILIGLAGTFISYGGPIGILGANSLKNLIIIF